jgi:hypothetical protein
LLAMDDGTAPSLEWTSNLLSDFTDLGQYVCP